MPLQLSIGGAIAVAVLLLFSLDTALTAFPALEAFGISALGLEPASGPRWLALTLRLVLAAITPFALLGFSSSLDRDGPRFWSSWALALAVSLAFVITLAAITGPLLSRSFASILVLVVLMLAALLAFRTDLLLQAKAEQDHPRPAALIRRDWLWFSALVVATLLLRALTFEEAFGRDLMVYVMVAERWLEGAALYAEVWDHKPPAGLIAVAFFVWLFGPTPLAVYLLGVVCFAVTLLGVLVAARRFAGSRAVYPAGLLWFAFGNDPLLGANQPNIEAFIIPCVVWSFALLAGSGDKAAGTWSLIGARRAWIIAGLFFLATAFKQVMIFLPAVVAVALLLANLRSDTWRPALSDCLRFAALGLVGWVATFAAFWAAGSFEAFYQAVFAYNQAYAGSLLENIAKGFLIVHRSPEAYPYVVAAILFGLVALLRSAKAEQRLIAAFLVGLGLAIFAPGRFYGHYYQLLTPVLAVVAGGLCARVAGRPLLLAFLASLFVFSTFTRYQPDRLPFLLDAGHGLESVESKRLGQMLAERLPAEATVFHWGAEPGLYFWSQRPAAVDFVYNYLLLLPEGGERSEELLAALQRLQPDLIVAKRQDMTGSQHPIVAWIARHYEVSTDYGASPVFDILVPRGR